MEFRELVQKVQNMLVLFETSDFEVVRDDDVTYQAEFLLQGVSACVVVWHLDKGIETDLIICEFADTGSTTYKEIRIKNNNLSLLFSLLDNIAKLESVFFDLTEEQSKRELNTQTNLGD